MWLWSMGILFFLALLVVLAMMAKWVLEYKMGQWFGGMFADVQATGNGPGVSMEEFIQLENQAKEQEVQSNALSSAVAGSYEMLRHAARNMNSLTRKISKLEERLQMLETKEENEFMMSLQDISEEEKVVAHEEVETVKHVNEKDEAEIESTVPIEDVVHEVDTTTQVDDKQEETEQVSIATTTPTQSSISSSSSSVGKQYSKTALMTKRSSRVREIAEEVIAETGGPPPTPNELETMSKSELVEFVLDRQKAAN